MLCHNFLLVFGHNIDGAEFLIHGKFGISLCINCLFWSLGSLLCDGVFCALGGDPVFKECLL